MADVRCPMCGKSNPEDLEVCQYCEARLKPLHIPSQPDEAVQPESSVEPMSDSHDQDSMDEWLSFLRQSDEQADSDASDEDLPDWMDEDLEDGLADRSIPPEGGGASEWLSDLRDQPDEGAVARPTDESHPEQERLPDSELPAEEKVPERLQESGIETGQEISDVPQNAASSEEEAAEVSDVEQPDWLRKVRSRRMAEEFESGPEMTIGPESEEWYQAEGIGETSAQPASPDNVSSWLSELSGEELPEGVQSDLPEVTKEQPALEQAELPAASEEVAAEPQELGKEAELGVTVEVAEQQGVEGIQTEEEIPDWLVGVVGGAVGAAAVASVDADIEVLPEWLADLEKSSTLDREEIVPFGEEGEELTFDWLQSQVRAGQELSPGETPASDMLTGEAGAGVVGPFVGDLSDFLEEAELSTLEVTPPPVEKADTDLAPADLPTWLEAMRPIGAAAAIYGLDDKDAQIESSGPLAGLPGILPAEPEIAQLKKPAVYALRLQVSENQRAHADLIEELVKSEGVPQEIPGRPAISSQHIFRLIIFGVLVLAIFWPIFTGSQTNPLPALSPETFDTSEIINNLPDNPLVLLAVDYDPGLAGEMEAAASAVVDNLMLKGTYLALVSTTPNGPAVGEHLIASVGMLSGHQYQGINQYANLGYIPGGPSGLLGFAQAPRQVAPYALDPESTDIWAETPLQVVQTLADFNLVAVITDDPDRARAWVEQVQPSLGNTPLVMVVSNQSDPLIRPYYQASPRQIQGMVVGLAGGGSYEAAHQDLLAGNGPARKYWDAYSLSVLAAAALIGIGGLVNVVTNLLSAQKQSKADNKP